MKFRINFDIFLDNFFMLIENVNMCVVCDCLLLCKELIIYGNYLLFISKMVFSIII